MEPSGRKVVPRRQRTGGILAILWGGIGLILAIPMAAGVKAVCDNVPDLQPYGKLLGD